MDSGIVTCSNRCFSVKRLALPHTQTTRNQMDVMDMDFFYFTLIDVLLVIMYVFYVNLNDRTFMVAFRERRVV